MRIGILSRGKTLHSIRRLIAEARKARIEVDIIDPLDCQLVVDGKSSGIRLFGQELPRYDAILPRIGASITDYGIALVKHFETGGTMIVNGSKGIGDSRDKWRCLQILAAAGLNVPASVLTRNPRNLKTAVDAVKGMPVVLKVLKGTQGVGVMIVHTPISLGSVHDTFREQDQDLIIQQFIAEGAGRDYRAFVIGRKVVAAMMRTAPEGEFRSNIHRGAEGKLVKLPKAFERAAIRAAQVLHLEVAGVDIMESHEGPLILEVNSSPGFEGIERATGLNIAGMIVRHIRSRIASERKPRARRASKLSASKKRAPRGRVSHAKRAKAASPKRRNSGARKKK